MFFLVALVSVLVPLSLCVVPTLARYTVFPLLSSLVARFGGTYLQSGLQVEYSLDPVHVRKHNSATEKEEARGVSILLYAIKIQREFLRTLNFCKDGLAPIDVEAVEVDEVVVRLASTWRLVVEVKGVRVRVSTLNPDATDAFTIEDAVRMKLAEADGLINQLLSIKTIDETRAKEQESNASEDNSEKAYSYYDRVLQLVLSQVDFHSHDVNVIVTADPKNVSGEVTTEPDGEVSQSSDADTVSESSIKLDDDMRLTQLRICLESFDMLSMIQHDGDREEALEKVLSSEDVRVKYATSLKQVKIVAGKLPRGSQTRQKEELEDEATLMHFPEIRLNAEVPPLARVLGLVQNLYPISLDKRLCDVDLTMPEISNMNVAREMLTCVIGDILVPYMNHQALVNSLRVSEMEESMQRSVNDEDKEFQVNNSAKREKLSEKDKERLTKIEQSMHLNSVLRGRTKALELNKYFDLDESRTQDGLDKSDCMYIIQKNAAKVENIMFRTMEIGLVLSHFKLCFVEYQKHMAELTLIGADIALASHTVPSGPEAKVMEIEMDVEQVKFSVTDASVSVGPAASPDSKLMYGDLSLMSNGTKSQLFSAGYIQYESGEMEIDTSLNHVRLVAAAGPLEVFLLYVDRLTTNLMKRMAAARPAVSVSEQTPDAVVQQQIKEDGANHEQQVSNLSPFSLLGGMLLDIDFKMNDCYTVLVPSPSFSDAISTGLDVSRHTSVTGVDSRIELPLSFAFHLESDYNNELMTLHAPRFGMEAFYFEGSKDAESILVPTSMTMNISLDKDKEDENLCKQQITLDMPDVVMVFSDLSLALLASCINSLSSIEMTTPEHAQMNLESRKKQEQLRRDAEMKIILDRLRQLFNDIDKDGNGHIEPDELLPLLRSVNIGESLLESEMHYFVKMLFNEIDTDGNGNIEFDELCAFLRTDVSTQEASRAVGEFDGSGHLDGKLDLRAGEYRFEDVIDDLCGANLSSNEDFEKYLEQEDVQEKFWQLYTKETGAKRHELGAQSPLDLQKKLVRLLKNWEAARSVYEKLVIPNLDSRQRQSDIHQWMLQASTRCGGVSEYQSAARLVAKKKRESIFANALTESEHLMQQSRDNCDAPKKKLEFITKCNFGTVHVLLMDPELPDKFHRGDFAIQDIKFSINLWAGDIDAHKPMDWTGVLTSSESEWTMLFGMQLIASCYSDVGDCMEDVIEPWELVAALSSGKGENGVAVLMEAAKRFQINVTPSLLKLYRALMDVLDGEAEHASVQKHEEAVQRALSAQEKRDATCAIENRTGCKVTLQLNEGSEKVEIDADDVAYTGQSAIVAGKASLKYLAVESWGETQGKVDLPEFGRVNVRVQTKGSKPETLLLSVAAYLDKSQEQRLVLESGLTLCNHTSEAYEVKYLIQGGEGRQAYTSDKVSLLSNQRMSLPATAAMGITEIYARPLHSDQWIVHGSLDGDNMTSLEAVQGLDQFEKERQEKVKSKRGGRIVYAENEDTSTHLVQMLTPNLRLRRWHLRSHIEFETSLLPPFVVRNALPYDLEYRFVEYKASGSTNPREEFTRLKKLLHADTLEEDTDIMCGIVSSGRDGEVAGVSTFSPGYISVRLVSKHEGSSKSRQTFYSDWCNPMLMAVHVESEHFTTNKPERVDLGSGIAFNADRLSLLGLPRLLRLSSPYWIINDTSFDLGCASTSPSDKKRDFKEMERAKSFQQPILASLEHDRVSVKPVGVRGSKPDSWRSLGKVSDAAFSSSALETSLADAGWTDPMNTTTINTVGEAYSGSNVLAVKVEGLYGTFERSIALTFGPRYVLQNRLKQKVWVQAVSSHETDVEKVDKHFHARKSEEATVAMSSLEDQETTPLYAFRPLEKNVDMATCSKYMSVSFSDSWGDRSDKEWSFCIPVGSAGDMHIQMYSSARQRYLICQASVQVIDMQVYVTLTDVSVAPPYRIENFTPFTVECAQLGDSSFLSGAKREDSSTVEAGGWHSFAWYNPLAKEHNVEVHLTHPGGETVKQQVELDDVGYHDPMEMKIKRPGVQDEHNSSAMDKVEISVQVAVDGGTRVLTFVETAQEMQRLEDQNSSELDEFQQRKVLFASSIDVRIAGFGLSLFDGLPQEVLFASCDVIEVEKKPSTLTWSFSILHFQLDNMLHSAKFPVIVNPVKSGFSDRRNKTPTPVLQFALDADVSAKVGVYKLMDLQLGALAVKLDIDYLLKLVKLVDPYLVSDTTVYRASMATLDKTLHEPLPPVPAIQVTSDGSLEHHLVYFDAFRIHAMSFSLQYEISRRGIVQTTTGNGRSIIMGFLGQIVGLIGSNMSGSPNFKFSEILIVRCFSTMERLQNQLVQNYVRQAVWQAYRVVGSADIIGNPVGLVEDLGSGVVEFLKITKNEVTGQADTRGEGVKMLGQTFARSGISTVEKITGSLDRFVSNLSDSEEEEEEEAYQQEESSSGTGFAALDGGLNFAKNFGKGITGIVTKPVEGAMKGGVGGLVSGVVKGVTGPGVVILKQVTSTSHGLAMGVQSTMVDRSPFGGRRRSTKLVDDGKVIDDFDDEHYEPKKLDLQIVGAKGLLAGNSCDPFCVVRIDDKEILATKILYNTLNPDWQERTQYALKGSEQTASFIVKDSYGGTIARKFGKVTIPMKQLQKDFSEPEYSSDLDAWVKTGEKPKDLKQNVSRAVAEKEYTLLTSDKPKRTGDYQVIVTILHISNLELPNVENQGQEGKLNKTRPYMTVKVGRHSSETKTSKLRMSGTKKGRENSVVWNDAFTFALKAKDYKDAEKDPYIDLTLKDDGTWKDVKLGFASPPLRLPKENEEASERTEQIPLKEKEDGSGKVVGYVSAKVQVLSASAVGATDDASRVGTVVVSCKFE